MNNWQLNLDLWLSKHIGGRLAIALFDYELSFSGWNAMQFAVQLFTPEMVWVFRPPSFCMFRYCGWVLYRSPDGTPGNADLMWCGRGWDSYRFFQRRSELKARSK